MSFLLVILGSLCLAAQNVLVRVLFVEFPILDSFSWGGWIEPSSANSVLILLMRSALILPVMAALSPVLYPPTWESLSQLVQPQQRSLFIKVLASSTFLFLALALLFIAIAKIPAGIATVLMFTHPAITVLLSWKIFGDRPSWLRLVVVVVVLAGAFLIAPSLADSLDREGWLGVGAALTASGMYSFQSILAQVCFSEIHPAPFTLINFIVLVVLCALLLVFMPTQIPQSAWLPLWGVTGVTAVLTLIGQLAYNFGINWVSAALTSIVAVSNPAFTAALAWLFLQETLQRQQVMGMLLVIVGVIVLSQEKLLTQRNQTS